MIPLDSIQLQTKYRESTGPRTSEALRASKQGQTVSVLDIKVACIGLDHRCTNQ